MTAKIEGRGSQARASVALNPHERVVVRATAITPTGALDLGWTVEAGVRF